MALEEIAQKVISPEIEERRKIFYALLHDPELKISPFDAINLRQNGEIALKLRSLQQGGTDATNGIAR